MIPAYAEGYVNTFSRSLGNLFHIAVVMEDMDGDEFAGMFATSEVAKGVENAHPLYLAGISSRTMFRLVTGTFVDTEVLPELRSPEFWGGYIAARAQREINCTFARLFERVPYSTIVSMYEPYHEMNESKMLEILKEKVSPENRLKVRRLERGVSQAELSRMTGVNLRSIVAYEQGEIDLENASGITLYRLSRTLNCTIEELITGR